MLLPSEMALSDAHTAVSCMLQPRHAMLQGARASASVPGDGVVK
jgi:hypothetical protein